MRRRGRRWRQSSTTNTHPRFDLHDKKVSVIKKVRVVSTNTFLLHAVREYFGLGVKPEIVIVRVDITAHAVFECVVIQNDTCALNACRDILSLRHVHVAVVDLNVPLFITYPVLLLVRFRMYLNERFVFSIIVPGIFGHPDDLAAMWFRSDEAQDVSGL